MLIIISPIIFTLLSTVSSRRLLEVSPPAEFGWQEMNSQEQLPQKADLNDGHPLRQMAVVQMHYDCQGRLVRQEVSELRIITGLFLIPEENNIILKAYKESKPLSMASEENNEINKIHEGVAQTEAPLFFKSIKKRIRPIPKTSVTQSVEEHKTVNVPVEEPPFSPQVNGQERNRKFKLIFDPDRIIDVPIRSCPVGENEDIFGRCRPVLPETDVTRKFLCNL